MASWIIIKAFSLGHIKSQTFSWPFYLYFRYSSDSFFIFFTISLKYLGSLSIVVFLGMCNPLVMKQKWHGELWRHIMHFWINRKLVNLLFFSKLSFSPVLWSKQESCGHTFFIQNIMLIFFTDVLFIQSFFMILGKAWILDKKESKRNISMQKY